MKDYVKLSPEAIFRYIRDRAMIDDNTPWKDVVIRFGGDPSFAIDGKLLGPYDLIRSL